MMSNFSRAFGASEREGESTHTDKIEEIEEQKQLTQT